MNNQHLESNILVIGISGPSSSGKTTVTKNLLLLFDAKILHQDDFYVPDDQIPLDPNTKEQNWDHPDAIDFNKFKNHIKSIKSGTETPEKIDTFEPDINIKLQQNEIDLLKQSISHLLGDITIVLVDGFMLFHDQELSSLFDLKLFYYSDHDCLKTRRSKRKGYSTVAGFWVDPPNYFDDYVWPAYEQFHKHLFINNDTNSDLNSYATATLNLHGFQNDDNTGIHDMVKWSVDQIIDFAKNLK